MPKQSRPRNSSTGRSAGGLTRQEVMIVVNRWIGVSGGYLGDLSYRTHAEFYPEYCNLDYDPLAHEGTTRERFIEILSNAPPLDQARIVQGVIERFPVAQEEAPATRTLDLQRKLQAMIEKSKHVSPVNVPDLASSTDAVRRAIADAEAVIVSGQSGRRSRQTSYSRTRAFACLV